MNRFLLALLAIFTIASPAAANTVNLGTLGSSPASIGDTFTTVLGSGIGSFTDYYTFKLNSPANIQGQTNSFSLGTVNLILKDISFYVAGSSTAFFVDTSPSSFSLNVLSSGNYTMAVSGLLSGTTFLPTGFSSYSGLVSANASATPLPPSWSMMVLALFGLGYFAYRSRNQAAFGTA